MLGKSQIFKTQDNNTKESEFDGFFLDVVVGVGVF